MRVMLGTTALKKSEGSGGLDGIGYYTQNLIQQLKREGGIEVFSGSFFRNQNTEWDKNSRHLGPFKTQAISSLLLRKPFRSEKKLVNLVDLFHATDHYLPMLYKIPMVATIHDVIPITYPKWYTLQQRALHKGLRISMRWPDHIITVSEYSKKEILRVVKVPPHRVSVIPNGVSQSWTRSIERDEITAVRKKYELSREYVIFVGTIQERKNISLLLTAFEGLSHEVKKRFDLVIVGKLAKEKSDVTKKFKTGKIEENVKWLGHIPLSDLQALTKGSRALVNPSLAEGFGLPLIEAFSVGTPVLSSWSSSLPEVAGNAAMLFDPNDASMLAASLERLLSDSSLAKQMIFNGRKRASQYTWEANAKSTLEVYQKVLKERQVLTKV
jgi:glycosyltransferase involved in cell wall biosynthesis